MKCDFLRSSQGALCRLIYHLREIMHPLFSGNLQKKQKECFFVNFPLEIEGH